MRNAPLLYTEIEATPPHDYHLAAGARLSRNHEEIGMRQQGGPPQQGSKLGKQDQMAQGEAQVWPFKPMDREPEADSPEYAPGSLNEVETSTPKQGRFSRPTQQG